MNRFLARLGFLLRRVALGIHALVLHPVLQDPLRRNRVGPVDTPENGVRLLAHFLAIPELLDLAAHVQVHTGVRGDLKMREIYFRTFTFKKEKVEIVSSGRYSGRLLKSAFQLVDSSPLSSSSSMNARMF